MKKILLISCVSQKLPCRDQARELYVSALFKKNLQFAESLKPDAIYVLSAKYGLVRLDEVIDIYDLTLNDMRKADVLQWASCVLNQLKHVSDIEDDHFIFLSGEKYRRFLIPHLGSYEVPMLGLPIGKQLQFLKSKLEG